MDEFRRLASRIDQHMQHLSAQGINDVHAIINHMMGYVPNLHKIWIETSDDQLIALSNEFPEFYRYALLMEEASETERNKSKRPYDGLAELPEQNKQLAAQLLATAATLERGYLAFIGSGNPQIFRLQVAELSKMHHQWLSDLDSFTNSLRTQGTDAKVLAYVIEAFARLAKRFANFAE